MGSYNNIHTPSDDFYYYCPDDQCPCHGSSTPVGAGGNDHDLNGLVAAFNAARTTIRTAFRRDRTPSHDESTCYICRPDIARPPWDNRPVFYKRDPFRDEFLAFSGIDLHDPFDRPPDLDDALERFESRRRHPTARPTE